MRYSIFPPEEMIENAVVTLPLSKSISTRALVLDALTPGRSHASDDAIAVCDDTEVIAAALNTVRPGEHQEVNLKASGAAIRFLTAFYASQPGYDVTLTGIERLCQRPMKTLVDALRQCGANIEYLAEEGYAPLRIKGTTLSGGDVTIDATISSQFISALLMVGPLMTNGLQLRFEGEPVSYPYITMTVGMMEQRGIISEREPLCVKVPHGEYVSFAQPAEGDWSASAFWYEISALSAGWISVTNLRQDTLQGDKAAARFFECLGVLIGDDDDNPGCTALSPSPEVYGRLDLDLADNPDLAPALAVTCCLIGVPFKFIGLQNLCVKECDRLEAICTEMDKIGRPVEKIRDFGLEWNGKGHPVMEMPVLDAHNDHRMAMALAPVSIYIPGIVIEGVESVSKSYPEYWDQLTSIGFTIKEMEVTE